MTSARSFSGLREEALESAPVLIPGALPMISTRKRTLALAALAAAALALPLEAMAQNSTPNYGNSPVKDPAAVKPGGGGNAKNFKAQSSGNGPWGNGCAGVPGTPCGKGQGSSK